MTITIDAVYEAGRFRPVQPEELAGLGLAEGQQVKLTVDAACSFPLHSQGPDPRRAAEVLAEIVALAVEIGYTDCASTDHDRILYGGPDGAR